MSLVSSSYISKYSTSHPKHRNLFLGLCRGLLQLSLGLLQLALQGMACCLQAADLRLPLLQRQRQLRHLPLYLQLLLLMLQTNLRGKRDFHHLLRLASCCNFIRHCICRPHTDFQFISYNRHFATVSLSAVWIAMHGFLKDLFEFQIKTAV